MRRSEMRSKKKNDIYTFWMCWFSVLKLIFPNDILIMRKRITSLGYELGKENMARCMQCPDCAWRSLSPTIRSKISLGEWIGWKGIEEKGLLIFKYYTQHTDFSLKIVYELYIFYMFNNMGILGFMKTERINILLAVWPKWLHLCVPAIFHYAIDEPLATLSYLSFDLIKFERSFVSGHSSARDRYTMQSCQTMRISSNGSVRWNQIKIDLLCQNVRCEGDETHVQTFVTRPFAMHSNRSSRKQGKLHTSGAFGHLSTRCKSVFTRLSRPISLDRCPSNN